MNFGVGGDKKHNVIEMSTFGMIEVARATLQGPFGAKMQLLVSSLPPDAQEVCTWLSKNTVIVIL